MIAKTGDRSVSRANLGRFPLSKQFDRRRQTEFHHFRRRSVRAGEERTGRRRTRVKFIVSKATTVGDRNSFIVDEANATVFAADDESIQPGRPTGVGDLAEFPW